MEQRQEYLEAAAVAPGRDSEEYRLAKKTCAELAGRRGLAHVFDKHDLDAVVFAIEIGGGSTITGSMGYALVSDDRSQLISGNRSDGLLPRWRSYRDHVCGQAEG